MHVPHEIAVTDHYFNDTINFVRCLSDAQVLLEFCKDCDIEDDDILDIYSLRGLIAECMRRFPLPYYR